MRPLHVDIVERKETPDWTREKARLAIAGKDPILVYLYLPKRTAGPHACLVFVAGANAFFEESVPEQNEPKKLVLVEGGHLPSPEARVPVINEWLDETLGPVT